MLHGSNLHLGDQLLRNDNGWKSTHSLLMKLVRLAIETGTATGTSDTSCPLHIILLDNTVTLTTHDSGCIRNMSCIFGCECGCKLEKPPVHLNFGSGQGVLKRNDGQL